MPYKYKNREKEYQKLYVKTHPKNFSKYNKKCSYKRRLETLLCAGGLKCKKCGFDDWRALQIDHINGGGNKNRLIQAKLRDDVKKYPGKYQVLCANCNWIKRYENKESFSKY